MKFGLNENNLEQINSVFREFSDIEETIIFGSRAKGNFRKGSDIDLTLKGKNLNSNLLNLIYLKLDDLYLPYFLDLSIYNKISCKDLLDYIDRAGVRIYKREFSTEDLKL